MELAYLVVDQSLQAFNQPLAPTGPTGLTNIGVPTPPTLTADPAALTLQLLQAQNSLVAAQNDLYTQWLGYLQNRISLYRDMGVMPIDSKGVWIEDVTEYHPAPKDDDSSQQPHLEISTVDTSTTKPETAPSLKAARQPPRSGTARKPRPVPRLRRPTLLPPTELEEGR